MVVIPVFVPLLQSYGLSMSEVLQTQALFALTIALCEVPSGYFADVFGRRNAILVGAAFNAFGFLSLFWADGFIDFLLYEFVLGIGFSLISGADLALLYDTELYLQQQAPAKSKGPGKSLSRLIAVESAASAVAGIAASLLLMWSLQAVVILQALTGLLPFFLAFLLVESPRNQTASEGFRADAKQILQLLLFGKPLVLWTALAIAILGLLSIYSFWIYQKFWEFHNVPLNYYGYIWAAFALVVSVSARFSAAFEKRLGPRNLLILIGVLPLFGLLGMALGSGWIAVAFGFAIQLSRGLSMSLFYEALNSRVPGDFRATINSLVGMGVRVVFIVTGPLLGYLLDRFGVTSTLLLLVVTFVPLIAMVLIPLAKHIRNEENAAKPADSAKVSDVLTAS